MMIFDTDILIWVEKGNEKAADIIQKSKERAISILTYMELLQCAPSKKHLKLTRDFIKEFSFTVLPLSESIGHRASIYLENYALSHGIRSGDALIAATAFQYDATLITGNAKHFKMIPDLEVKIFKPN
jgi:predicted nucleic acid-binding protein